MTQRPTPPPPHGASALLLPFRRFARLESASGILLMLCALAALAWANSPWGHAYQGFREYRPAGIPGILPLELFVNDVLMTVFFLLMGLEIKREMIAGELASLKRSALPIAGALGGMLVPAGIFLALNHGLPGARGWGIPMATDIAFALGVLTLLGRRVPVGLKVFLVALAIIDDVGAIVVIAVFYTGDITLPYLLLAGAALAALVLLNRGGVRRPLPFLLGGALLWFCMFHSGVHATIAGVLLAFCIPHSGKGPSLLQSLESRLHPYVSFGIMPLFALINAGVALSPAVRHALFEPVGLGILAGLCLGKPLGITLFSWLAVRCRIASLPGNVSWPQLAGAGILGGIGFTMSIFIAGLGLPDRELLDGAKLAVLGGSVISGVAGYLILRWLGKKDLGIRT
jgi:NhaA family Na+:H+ antiporter